MRPLPTGPLNSPSTPLPTHSYRPQINAHQVFVGQHGMARVPTLWCSGALYYTSLLSGPSSPSSSVSKEMMYGLGYSLGCMGSPRCYRPAPKRRPLARAQMAGYCG